MAIGSSSVVYIFHKDIMLYYVLSGYEEQANLTCFGFDRKSTFNTMAEPSTSYIEGVSL